MSIFASGNDRARRDTVARQPGRHVLNMRQRIRAIDALLRNFSDRNFLGGTRGSAAHRGRPCALPSRPSTPPARSSDRAIDRRRHDDDRPACLHQEITRIRRAAGIDDRLSARPDHEKIGGAGLLGDVSRRQSARAERHSAALARGSIAPRNSDSSSDSRLRIDCSSSRESFARIAPSAKYSGGLRSDAAMPTTRAPNRSAISPATARQASFARSSAKHDHDGLVVHVPAPRNWPTIKLAWDIGPRESCPLLDSGFRTEPDLDQEDAVSSIGSMQECRTQAWPACRRQFVARRELET